jgi:hypothetical protein
MIVTLSIGQLVAVIAAALVIGTVISYSMMTGQVGSPL